VAERLCLEVREIPGIAVQRKINEKKGSTHLHTTMDAIHKSIVSDISGDYWQKY
jgi:hypothetical protein